MKEVFRHVSPVDLVDIFLVAMVIYALVSWLHLRATKTTVRRLTVAIALVTAVYVLARIIDLYLFERLIQVLLIVILLGAVVVFQSDIRRMLDRAGTWNFFRPMVEQKSAVTVDLLVEAIGHLADKKTGALIAIRGREPWESFTHGGIRLSGLLSQPLLYSVFDPDSPGHDGAALVEDNRLVKFAVHLPLSTKQTTSTRFGGTRHAAALGLSEECDACVIAVSEERGTISIAQDGVLKQVPTAGELKERLSAFYERHYSEPNLSRLPWWRRWSTSRGLVSLGLATMLWLLFVYSPYTTYRTFVVPVNYRNLPDNWALDPAVPSEARVALTGTDRSFRRLDPANLVISVDVSNPDEGIEQVVVDQENLNLPAGLDLVRVEPNVLYLRPRPLEAVRVPIHVPTSGELPDSLVLVNLTPNPDSVSLLVPEGTGLGLNRVSTEILDLGRISGNGEVRRGLVMPENSRRDGNGSRDVIVHVEVRNRLVPATPGDQEQASDGS